MRAPHVGSSKKSSVLTNVSTLRSMPNKPAMVMRSHRYPAKLYEAAMAKAAKREENLSDVLRAALEVYVKGDN